MPHFVDRDMQKLTDFDMECEINSAELLARKGYCLHWQGEGICNTGDTFLTELSDVKGDVVDMEAYARHGCAVPKYTVHRGEVCNRYHRAEFGEALGG